MNMMNAGTVQYRLQRKGVYDNMSGRVLMKVVLISELFIVFRPGSD